MLHQVKEKRGFTLIEVVLVMAIAGLIMVIVFLALSGAQRSRRDTARKNDLSRIAAQLEQYASNNNGNYPAAGGWNTGPAPTFASAYITPLNLQDPGNGSYASITSPAATLTNCTNANQAGVLSYVVNNRVYTLRMCLEQGYTERTNQ